MPISATCECGKQVKVKDELAGKRVKCPGCGKPLQIPSASAPQSTATGDSIAVSCQCGKKIAAPAKFAGKSVKCPQCSQPLKIPLPEQDDNGIGDLLDDVGVRQSQTGVRCPQCGADMKADAVLCIECGMNVETGKRLKQNIDIRESGPLGVAKAAKSAKGKGSDVPTNIPPQALSLAKWLHGLGVLNIVLPLLAVAGLSIMAYGLASQVEEMGMEASPALLFAYLPFVIISLVFSVPFFIAERFVKQGKMIGRVIAIVLGVIYLPGIPLGTIFGVVLLMKAFSAEVKAYCR